MLKNSKSFYTLCMIVSKIFSKHYLERVAHVALLRLSEIIYSSRITAINSISILNFYIT